MELQQNDNTVNPLLDLDLLDPEEKKALSFSNPSPSPLGFREVSKAFSSIILLLPARQVELDALRVDHKLWDYDLLTHKAPFSLSSLALIFSLSDEVISQCKALAIQARQVLAIDFLFDLPLIKLSDIDPSKCSNFALIVRTKCAINPDKSKDPKKFLKNY